MLGNSNLAMSYQKIVVLVSLLLLGSCNYFYQPKANAVLKKDTIIDFHTIDTYPMFPNCTELLNKEEQKQCFYAEISQQIHSLLKESFRVKRVLNDTIFMKIKIDNQGDVSIVNIRKNELLQQNIPQFDSVVASQLKQLPSIQPATKRGIPVTTEFTLPLIVNTKSRGNQ